MSLRGPFPVSGGKSSPPRRPAIKAKPTARNLLGPLDSVLDAAITLADADFGSVLLLSPGGRLRVVAQRGFPDWWVAFRSMAPSTHGIASLASAKGERVLVEDIDQTPGITDRASLERLRKLGIRALQATPLRSRSGEILGVFSTLYRANYRPSDKTLKLIDLLAEHAAALIEHQRSEQALQERLQIFLANVPVALAMFDLDMRYLVVSKRWCDDYELGGQELVGRSHYEVFPEIGDDLKAVHRRALAGETIRDEETRFVRLSGRVLWVRWEVLPWHEANGEVGGIVLFTEDVTLRKRAQLALDIARRQLIEAQKIAHLGSLELDVSTQTLAWSDELYRIHGLDPGKPPPSVDEVFSRLVHPDDVEHMRAWHQEAMESPARYDHEYRIVRPDGSVRWVHTRTRPYLDAEGRLQRYVGTTLDITERKEAEAANIAAEAARRASETKSRFLASASHDLRQPLQAISLYAGALSAGGVSEEQQNILKRIGQSIENLGDILNHLLDISKLDAGMIRAEPSVVHPESVVAFVEEEFAFPASRNGLSLKLFLNRRCPPLWVDYTLLTTVVRNLVDNAIKYTERGGVLVSLRPRGDRALLQVWDTGVGIAPQDQSRIFEEYFQTGNPERNRAKGFGLGLSIAKRVAALLDGALCCRSRPGRGSVFELSLPLAASPRSAADDSAAPETNGATARSAWSGKCIVIIEDDVAVAEAMKLALEARNIRPLVFRTAEEALASVEARSADFFVCDYRLPGMSGADFLEAIRYPELGTVKAVLLTGETAPERIAGFKANGWPILTKPVDISTLLATLARL